MAFDIRETTFKLPENWKLVRLGDIAKVNEKSLTKKSQPDFIRYIDISSVSTGAFDTPKLLKKDETPSRAKRILRSNDVIISTVRPNLKQFSFIEEAQENLIASTGFCVISSNNSKLAWYLYSLITSDLFTEYLVKIADGGAYPAFNPKEIEDAIIPLPDKDNLEFISDTSRFFHKKIQLNTQINQTLEQIAQALFKSWFVDFDPVHAKVQALSDGLSLEQAELAAMQAISGKTPEELTSLSQAQPDRYAELAETAKAFPCEMVEVDGVEVPKGWEVKRIEEVIKKIPVGKKYSSKTAFSEGLVPILDQGRSGVIGYHNDEPGVKASIEDPIIVFANHTCYMRLISYDFSAIQNVFAFKGKECDVFWVYLATLGKQEFVEYKGHFPDFLIKEIIVPPKKLTALFRKYVKESFSKIFINDRENSSLAKIRDLLLPKLLNGEI